MNEVFQCAGACHKDGGHSDLLYRVRVTDQRTGKDWGEFLYCMRAVRRDEHAGLRVDVINEVVR